MNGRRVSALSLLILLCLFVGIGTPFRAGWAQNEVQTGCGSLSAGECRIVGLRLQFGMGMTQDLARALALFEDACGLGDSLACTEAGVAYATGFGTRVDPDKARTFYARGCTRRRPSLCRDHGLSYLDPNSPVQNTPKGISILGEACWVGSVQACRRVANANAAGDLGKSKLFGYIDSIRFYQEACLLGATEACMTGSALIASDPALRLFDHARARMLDLACREHGVKTACALQSQSAGS